LIGYTLINSINDFLRASYAEKDVNSLPTTPSGRENESPSDILEKYNFSIIVIKYSVNTSNFKFQSANHPPMRISQYYFIVLLLNFHFSGN
jgi:hypothetical protein